MDFGDLVDALFGTGGDGDTSAADSANALLAWFRQQAADQEKMSEREKASADASAMVRRNELADRTGYSGLINVGPAQERSDATLAAQMAGLDIADPSRVAYEEALAKERTDTETQKRTASGEQWAAEDALAKINVDLTGADLDATATALAAFKTKYSWYDTGDLAQRIENERERRKAAAEAAANAAPANYGYDPNQYGGGV